VVDATAPEWFWAGFIVVVGGDTWQFARNTQVYKCPAVKDSCTHAMLPKWAWILGLAVLGTQCSQAFSMYRLEHQKRGTRADVHLQGQACANRSAVRGEPWTAPMLDPRPRSPYCFVRTPQAVRPALTPQNSRNLLRSSSVALMTANDTLVTGSDLRKMSKRMDKLESLLEQVLYAFTNSDDLALLERDALRTLIVDEGMGKERSARLLRTSLLTIMRANYIPLPPSAKLHDTRTNGTQA